MRLLPPLVLLVLSPFVGEFLLGNIAPDPAAWVAVFLPLVLLYGGGALLVREVARRLGRGYPTMVIFALAYALVEEGIVLSTLFNREYLGLDLLEYGWMPQLGTSPVWAGYVIGIHSIWSILIPVVLTEHLFPKYAARPWLRIPGTVVVALMYVLGAAVVGLGNYYTYRFFPSHAQLLTVVVLAGACIAAGLLIRPSRGRGHDGRVPATGVLAAVALLGGSVFILIQESGPVPVGATLAIMTVAVVATVATLGVASRRTAWSARHTLGATSGALTTYGWAGFLIQFSIHGFSTTGLVAQLVFVAITGALLALCWRRIRVVGSKPDPAAHQGSTTKGEDIARCSPAVVDGTSAHWARPAHGQDSR